MQRSKRVLVSWYVDPRYIPPFKISDQQVVVGPRIFPDQPQMMYAGWTPQGVYDLPAVLEAQGIRGGFDAIIVAADASKSNRPVNLQAFDCPKILCVGDTHHLDRPLTDLVSYATRAGFDFVATTYNRQHLHWFAAAGATRLAWLPGLSLVHTPRPFREERVPEILFVGQTAHHPHRRRLLEALRDQGLPLVSTLATREEAADRYAAAAVSFNASLNGDLNLRVFEVLSAGGCLLTDRLSAASWLGAILQEDRDFFAYGTVEELLDKARYLLAHPATALAAARAGNDAVVRHFLPERQAERLLAWVFDGRLDALYSAAGDPRSGDTGAAVPLDRRIAAYEKLQELQCQGERPRVLFSADVPAVYLRDAGDLHRLDISVGELGQPVASVGWNAVVVPEGVSPPAPLEAQMIIAVAGLGKTAPPPSALPAGIDAAALAAQIEASLQRGIAAQNVGRNAEAERSYRDALRLDPGHPRALWLLGMLAGMTGRLPLAAAIFRQALERDPSNANLHHNLGETYRHLGDFTRAHECFRRTIELQPQHYLAYRSAADCALEASAQAQAAKQPEAARGLRSLAAQCLSQLGDTLVRLARPEDGEAAYREAIALDPQEPVLQVGLATLLRSRGRVSESLELLEAALKQDPGSAAVHGQIGSSYYDLGRHAEAEAAYIRALQLEPAWYSCAQAIVSLRLMTPLYEENVSAAEIYDRHRRWGEEAVAAQSGVPAPRFWNDPDPSRRLRVGYVSPDFRRHSVAYFFEPLLAAHDPAEVEVFCYAELEAEDEVTLRLKALAENWRPIFGLADEDVRRQIRDDRIDILVDLAGHSSGSRIAAFAVKPAPVTATWLGYPATTGLPTVDWRITDALADPEGAECVHTERLLRLPDGFLCFRPPEDAPAVAPLPALASGRVTFGSFNGIAKTTPATAAVWAEILRAVPGSRLLCKAAALVDPLLRQRYLDLFAAAGIGPDRIDLRSWITAPGGHLAIYGEVDIALDPFPYNGTTTTCDALWMGVPVVSLAGDRHAGRVGLSLLTRVGLGDLVAADRQDYVRIAAALAADLPALARLRAGLRPKMAASPLCDAPGFARNFEAGLREMWGEWCVAQVR